jgi:hypothetical protein
MVLATDTATMVCCALNFYQPVFAEGFSSHSIGVWGGGRKRKTEKKGKRESLWEIKHILLLVAV